MIEVNGLDKASFKETKKLVDESIKLAIDRQCKKWDDLKSFKKDMYDRFDIIQETLISIEFKHNWKTAAWVFIGSFTAVIIPTVITIVFFYLSNN